MCASCSRCGKVGASCTRCQRAWTASSPWRATVRNHPHTYPYTLPHVHILTARVCLVHPCRQARASLDEQLGRRSWHVVALRALFPLAKWLAHTVRTHTQLHPLPQHHPHSTLTLTPCRTHTVHNSIHHASCHVHILTARMNRRALVQGHPRVGHLSSSRHAHSHTRTCTRTRTPTHSDEIPAGEGG